MNNEEFPINREIIDFLYNGAVAFYPQIFLSEKTEAKPAIFYSGQNKEEFEKTLINITRSENLTQALETIKAWKIAVERGEEIKSTIPINLEDLVAAYEKKEESQEPQQKAEEVIKKNKEQVQPIVNLKNISPQTESVTLTADKTLPITVLNKEQQNVVKLAHQDPKNFADQLTKKIVETSKLNPQNPLEKASAEYTASLFTAKLLEIDPSKKEFQVDSSPFEVLALFADPKNQEAAKIFPDPKEREVIAKTALNAAYLLESDTTKATNFINQALPQGDWSPFFIPPQIRNLKVTTEEEAAEKGGVNLNLKTFLTQMSSFESLEKQIKEAVISPNDYLQLTKAEKAKLEKEIQKIAQKTTSMSQAFNYSVKKEVPAKEIGWLNVQYATLGIPNLEQNPYLFINFDFGSFTSPHLLSSPLANMAFNQIIQRIPAVTKLKTTVSGMTAKIGEKAAAKAAATKLGASLAANVVPVVGQAVSIITTALSLKDIATSIKVWLKENSDKLPYFLAALMVGGFISTGIPLFLAGGASVLIISERVAIGAFAASLFAALGGIILSSILIPILIILIGIPVLVIIILFIINSGAYMYPPGTATTSAARGGVVSPYIGIEKKPEPSGPFANTDLPLEVKYTVTITAKQGVLTNVKINYSCNVIKESSQPECPQPNPAIPSGVDKIEAGTPFSFSYTHHYEKGIFEDSLVTDTITVQAIGPDGQNTEFSTSAGVKIGNPPEDCPHVWPTESGYITQGAFCSADSHSSLEAIDIGVSEAPVYATHRGMVVTAATLNCYGGTVDIKSTCNGKEFISRYSHLKIISVSTGQLVNMGQQIAISGNTGSCSTGPHLHYDFRYYPSLLPTNYPNNPPFMMHPFIPKEIPRKCCSVSECHTNIP